MIMNTMRYLLVSTLAVLMTGIEVARAEATEWLIAPYVWLSDVTLEQDPGGSGAISAQDLLDKSDAVAMIRIEAVRERFGMTVDYIYLDLSDTRVVPPSGPNVPVSVSLTSEFDLTIFELGGFYRPSAEDTGIQYLFGYRGISTNTTILATPANGVTQRVDIDAGLSDVFLGARYLYRYNRWDFAARADYSFGESDGVLNLLASAGFRFSEWFALQGGYRYVALEYSEESDQGEPTATEVELSGPFLGFVFRF